MAYKINTLLGKILKVSGYEGAVIVKLDRYLSENIPPMESVFLEIDGRPVPFFIEYSEYSGADVLKLKFAGYDSSHQTNEFVGCKVFLTDDIPQVNKVEDLHDILNFDLFDQTKRYIGKVTDIIPNPGQILLQITCSDKTEFLIPLHENLIVNFDSQKRTLVMDIPEGLTDLN